MFICWSLPFLLLSQLFVFVAVDSVRRRPAQDEIRVSEVSVCDGPLPGVAPRFIQNQTLHRYSNLEKGERATYGEQIITHY